MTNEGWYIVYGRSNCPACKSALELIPEAVYVDIEKHPDEKKYLQEQGFTTIPVIYYTTTTLIGGYTDLVAYLEENE